MDSTRNAAAAASNVRSVSPDLGKSEKVSSERMIVFVLGGPGSGKGTQCSKLSQHYGFCHLSAGELLEKEVQSASENGTMIKEFKMEGKLVPTEIVIKLLQQAMEESENKKFLIDGFPRNEENRIAAENINIKPDIVLYFECFEETMIRRILSRNQGRADDNLATASKRVKVFYEISMPIISYYDSQGKVYKIDAELSVEEVFEATKNVIQTHSGN